MCRYRLSVAGSSTGPLIRRVLVNQFQRLRDGDRFWYQRTFSGSTLQELENTTLAGVMRRDTALSNLQGNAFFFRVEVSGSVFRDGNRDGRRQATERGLAGMIVQLLDAGEESVLHDAESPRDAAVGRKRVPQAEPDDAAAGDPTQAATRAARRCGLVAKNDLIAVVFAAPGKRAGATDTVRVVRA